jgi:hypothetical protein
LCWRDHSRSRRREPPPPTTFHYLWDILAPTAGWNLEEDDAKRMLATIRLALKNPDTERLLKHSREALSVETGWASRSSLACWVGWREAGS